MGWQPKRLQPGTVPFQASGVESLLQRLGPHAKAGVSSGVPELAIECRECDFRADRFLPGQGRRELDRVVAAQREVPGESLRACDKCLRDRDLGNVRPVTREGALSLSPTLRLDDPQPDSFRQCRCNLGSTEARLLRFLLTFDRSRGIPIEARYVDS